MAKIENRALRDLVKSESMLKATIAMATASAKDAENDYNRLINEKSLAEKELREVQDAIALLEKQSPAMKNRAKENGKKF